MDKPARHSRSFAPAKPFWVRPLVLSGLGLALFAGAATLVLVKGANSGAVLRFALPQEAGSRELPRIFGPKDARLPLIVIDAGHGGYDPGALYTGIKNAPKTAAGIPEKELTLGLALALRDELVWEGGVRVALTREGDRYLSLDERVEIAEGLKADLFLSLHADSDGGVGASGGTVYTLSAKASSAADADYATRENSADIALSGEAEEAPSTGTALELRGSVLSQNFAKAIERDGGEGLKLRPYPLRSANLRVLQADNVPSVLYEAGFISHGNDVMRLASPVGRAAVAEGLGRAVRAHFSAHPPKR